MSNLYITATRVAASWFFGTWWPQGQKGWKLVMLTCVNNGASVWWQLPRQAKGSLPHWTGELEELQELVIQEQKWLEMAGKRHVDSIDCQKKWMTEWIWMAVSKKQHICGSVACLCRTWQSRCSIVSLKAQFSIVQHSSDASWIPSGWKIIIFNFLTGKSSSAVIGHL